MTTQAKILLGAVGVLVVGALIGWSASRYSLSRPPATLPSAAAIAADTLATGMTPGADRGAYGYSVGGPVAPSPVLRDRAPVATAPAPRVRTTRRTSGARSLSLAGESFGVSVDRALSSGTDGVGAPWSGTVEEPVLRDGRVIVPAGSRVAGTVVASQPAARGERAMLQLAITSVNVNGRSYRVSARSEAVTAGSPRARNVGAIAAGTAAGALIGHAVGGSSRGTVIGAVLGGGAATAGVAASHGYQARIGDGSRMTFHGR